jgi:SpoVK/Ycf46/Vps4 family AAA+-type ATPase
VFSIDYAALNSDPSAKTLEESCVRVFGEARRKLPSVVYLPHIDSWWATSSEPLR